MEEVSILCTLMSIEALILLLQKQIFINPNYPKSTTWFCLILMDSVLHSIAQRIEHVAMCTKSIKLHRLLLLDPGLCIAKPWMLCICYCTNSMKLHRLLLLDPGLCIAKPWMLCICYCTNSIKFQQLGYFFTACYWILEDLGWFLPKMPRELGIVLYTNHVSSWHALPCSVTQVILYLVILLEGHVSLNNWWLSFKQTIMRSSERFPPVITTQLSQQFYLGKNMFASQVCD